MTSWPTPACWCLARGERRQDLHRALHPQGAAQPDFATPGAFQALAGDARPSHQRPGVAARRVISPSRSSRPSGALMRERACRSRRAEVAKPVVEGNAEFGLTLSARWLLSGAVIAGPLPAPFRSEHLLRAVMAGAPPRKRQAAWIATLDAARTRRPGSGGVELP